MTTFLWDLENADISLGGSNGTLRFWKIAEALGCPPCTHPNWSKDYVKYYAEWLVANGYYGADLVTDCVGGGTRIEKISPTQWEIHYRPKKGSVPYSAGILTLVSGTVSAMQECPMYVNGDAVRRV